MPYTSGMPYSGNPPINRGTKFAWARLNADALFLALYASFVGFFGIIDPSGSLVRELGYASASHYLVHGAYLFSGLLLMVALMREWVVGEVTARAVLTWSVCFELARQVAAFGWYPDGIKPFIIVVIVGLTSLLRLSVLLSKKGIVVHLPQRNGESS